MICLPSFDVQNRSLSSTLLFLKRVDEVLQAERTDNLHIAVEHFEQPVMFRAYAVEDHGAVGASALLMGSPGGLEV
jgi:hypothetical protein